MEESTNTKLMITNKPLGQINLPLNIKDNLHIPDVPNSLEIIPRAKGIILYEFIFYSHIIYLLSYFLISHSLL